VTVKSITVVDIERKQSAGGAFIDLFVPDGPSSLIAIPFTGDNGVLTIGGINLAGVQEMRVTLNGSGAITSIVVEGGGGKPGGPGKPPKPPKPEPGPCWFTFGGFQNANMVSKGKDFTFGGNVGPPPSGVLTVNDQTTGDKFHAYQASIVECLEINTTGPGQPGGKKGLTTNKAVFQCEGRLNKVDGYPCDGWVIDGGEPGGKKGNAKDEFHIFVYDPNDLDTIVFEATGELDGGNVQIHPGK